MGPVHKRTTNAATTATTPKMRSLRIMLLSRSKRHKARSSYVPNTNTHKNSNNNNNNNNNSCNNKKRNKNNTRLNLVIEEQTKKIEETKEKNNYDTQHNQQKRDIKLKKEQVNKVIEKPEIIENKNIETDSLVKISVLSKRPAHEKVLYDNRIKRKNVLALNEKVAAIREYEKMPVYKRIGRMFQCSPDQIKRIVQQKDSILKAWEQRTRRCQDAKTLELKVVRVSMLGKAVYDWIRRMMYYKDFMITDGLIQKMALQFKSAMGLQNFFPHQDWCDKFRQTYKILENDSKLLSIGYTQGHSVQIKDIMKDVLSECTPDLMEDTPANYEVNYLKKKNSKISLNESKETIKQDHPVACRTNNNTMDMHLTKAEPKMRQLQLPRLLTLPLQRNSSKILVATPLSTNAQINTTSPMTMTIIPLATITKPLQNSACAEPLVAAAEKQMVPSPILIKSEIKEEINSVCQENNNIIDQKENLKVEKTTNIVNIKEEYISDDDEDISIISDLKESCKTYINDDMEDDNLALSNLRKIIQNESKLKNSKESNSIKRTERESTITSPPTTARLKTNAKTSTLTTATIMPITTSTTTITTSLGATDYNGNNKKSLPSAFVMPTPKRTPTLTLTPIENLRAPQPPPMVMATSTQQHDSIWNNALTLPVQHLPPLIKAPFMPALTPRPVGDYMNSSINRSLNKMKRSETNMPCNNLAAIKTSSEARRYLKLLEDFALQTENYRLIGLITRADEVLREHNGDDDDDVDID